MRLVVVALTLVLLSLLAPSAMAAAPDMRTYAEADVVAVGDEVDLTMTAMSSGNAPTKPTLAASGFRITSTSVMPQQQVMVVNGIRSDKQGLNVTWTLHATQVGTFSLSPTVELDGIRYKSSPVTIRVVPQGTAVPRPQNNPFQNPFGAFGNLFGGGDPFTNPEPDAPPQFPLDPKLALDKARDTVAFVHATIDKSHVVVGEQVTFTIYLYVDTSSREPDFNDAHEATTSDFIRKSLMKDDTNTEDAGFANVGGHVFSVKVLRRAALFPLKTGDLEIGPMKLAMAPRGGARESETLTVNVGEPPMAGRPAGYQSGDVGSFKLTADVSPRTTPRGSVVAVTMTLEGTGNLPSELPLPIQAGVRWLEPEVREKLGPVGANRFGGSRTFEYVVRAEREGDLDLGEIAVPFFDPDTRTYQVARATLGTVHVTPGDGPRDDVVAALPELPPARTSLGGTRAAASHLTDRTWTWPLLGGPPLSFALVAFGSRTVRRAKERAAQRRSSPEALLKEKERQLDLALDSDDAGAIDAASIRFIEAAVVARLGKNLRALTGMALVRELEEAGATDELAVRFRDVLASCEAARFAPDAASSKDARGRADEARAVVRALAKAQR